MKAQLCNSRRSGFLLCVLCLVVLVLVNSVHAQRGKATIGSYESAVSHARQLLLSRQFKQSNLAAELATRLDGSRPEAHLIAAAALKSQKLYPAAIQQLRIALTLASDELKPEIFKALSEVQVDSLSSSMRQKLDNSMAQIEAASRLAENKTDRNKILQLFLQSSNELLDEFPVLPKIWALRAEVALELNEPELGWIAGRQLVRIVGNGGFDPADASVIGKLKRRGWLNDSIRLEDWSVVSINSVKQAARLWRLSANDPNWNLPRNDAETLNQAAQFYQTKANSGYASGYVLLSFLHANFNQTSEGKTKAINLARKAAALGDVRGQIWLAEAYKYGFGNIRPDPKQSFIWNRLAAAQNNPFAEQYVAFNYRNGEGITRDDSEAMRWYLRSAQHAREQGYLGLENSLAWLFATDPEPEFRDADSAVKYALAACTSSSYKDAFWVDTLAAAYAEKGDWEQAVSWEQKAIDILPKVGSDVEQNHKDFQSRLELFKRKQAYREKQVPLKDLFGTSYVAGIHADKKVFDQALADAHAEVDSLERFRKLSSLSERYPQNDTVSKELKQAAHAVSEDLPLKIASSLNSLGKIKINPGSSSFISSTVEYKTEPMTCGISLFSTKTEYFTDMKRFNQDTYDGWVTFPLKKVFSTIELQTNSNSNPSVFVYGNGDDVKIRVRLAGYSLHKGQPQFEAESYNNYEPSYSFIFAPNQIKEAELLRDRLMLLKEACYKQF